MLELTERVPEPVPVQPAPQPAQPAPRVAEPPAPVQRAVDRLREAEARRAPDVRPVDVRPVGGPRPVPADLMPRNPTSRSVGNDATLEQLAREMLEPMLAEWIERNLPDMVERLVQAEIQRMIENR